MKTKNKLLNRIFLGIFLLTSSLMFAQTNTSPFQTVCAGSVEPYLINPPTPGSTYQWSITGGGTIINGSTTDNITVNWGFTPGVYTVSVIETDANGCIGFPITVDVTVNPLPTATIATSQTACFGTTIPDLTAIGSNVTWYSDAALTVQVGTGNNFATGQSAAGVYTYYATQNDGNGCESYYTIATLEIYSLPNAPTTTNQIACFGTTIPDLTAIGSNIVWYSNAALTAQVGTGNNLVTGQSSVGIYTYYATTTDVNGCESLSSLTTLEIYALPAAPTAANQTACVGGVIPDLSSSGTNSIWYSDPALTTQIGTGSTFSTGQTSAGVYTYYVTETNSNGCESSATTVTLTINSFTSVPITSNVNACFGTTIPDLTASGVGTTFTWYDDAALTNIVGNNSPFTTGQTAVGIYTYYVTESQNGCQSPAATVTLEIYSLPTTGPINHW